MQSLPQDPFVLHYRHLLVSQAFNQAWCPTPIQRTNHLANQLTNRLRGHHLSRPYFPLYFRRIFRPYSLQKSQLRNRNKSQVNYRAIFQQPNPRVIQLFKSNLTLHNNLQSNRLHILVVIQLRILHCDLPQAQFPFRAINHPYNLHDVQAFRHPLTLQRNHCLVQVINRLLFRVFYPL